MAVPEIGDHVSLHTRSSPVEFVDVPLSVDGREACVGEARARLVGHFRQVAPRQDAVAMAVPRRGPIETPGVRAPVDKRGENVVHYRSVQRCTHRQVEVLAIPLKLFSGECDGPVTSVPDGPTGSRYAMKNSTDPASTGRTSRRRKTPSREYRYESQRCRATHAPHVTHNAHLESPRGRAFIQRSVYPCATHPGAP
eukprot:CAMPEP_0180342816 /NCGR_PEP_ID=MMETSP0989-20121125/1945_1 /TAXON_ID=697907 /ORGANISM="non described non described, Strain CCMP2293" /LENGTH=195 /DNA_ID=CAMNT_0022331713 /DNA_START=114 /DNA_END=702 /DNA_ORIENTATION=-